jgi:hypothetical protein
MLHHLTRGLNLLLLYFTTPVNPIPALPFLTAISFEK